MKKRFYNQSFEKLKSAIINIDKNEIKNIYALSFWFYNEDDELHFPTIILSLIQNLIFRETLKTLLMKMKRNGILLIGSRMTLNKLVEKMISL